VAPTNQRLYSTASREPAQKLKAEYMTIYCFLRYQVFTAVTMKNAIFWDI
jgi:hypothetical protein